MDKWTIDKELNNEIFNKHIKGNNSLAEKWDFFKEDVTNNPYFNPKHKRIIKLEGKTSFPPGSYRYKREPLRVVYLPDGETKTVYPLAADSTTQISYKKKTRGK